jgi:hypothetical protein
LLGPVNPCLGTGVPIYESVGMVQRLTELSHKQFYNETSSPLISRLVADSYRQLVCDSNKLVSSSPIVNFFNTDYILKAFFHIQRIDHHAK